MRVQDIPFRHFYIRAFVNVLFGIIAITYSVQRLQLDPNTDWKVMFWIVSLATLGSMLFLMGIGFCMAWIAVPDTSVHGVAGMPPNRDVAVTSADEKDEKLFLHCVYTPADE